SDNSDILYDVYLDDKLIQSNLKVNNFTINQLLNETTYSGSIVAKSNRGKETKQEFTFKTKKDEVPSAFFIEVEILSKSEVKVTWTASTLSSGEKVVYDLSLYDSYFKKEILVKDVSALEHDFKELYHGGILKLKITAKSTTGKTNEEVKEFQTYGTPPQDFTISYEEQYKGVFLIWEHPIVPDGSDYHYRILVNDEIHTENLINDFGGKFVINDLEEGTEYTFTVIADATTYNNTKTESSITLKTKVYPEPDNNIELTTLALTATKYHLSWTPSKAEEETNQVQYFVYINGQEYEPNQAFGS